MNFFVTVSTKSDKIFRRVVSALAYGYDMVYVKHTVSRRDRDTIYIDQIMEFTSYLTSIVISAHDMVTVSAYCITPCSVRSFVESSGTVLTTAGSPPFRKRFPTPFAGVFRYIPRPFEFNIVFPVKPCGFIKRDHFSSHQLI